MKQITLQVSDELHLRLRDEHIRRGLKSPAALCLQELGDFFEHLPPAICDGGPNVPPSE